MGKLKRLVTCIYLVSALSRLTLAALPLPDNYDSSTRPNQGSVADVVNVSMDVLAIRGLDETNSEMTLDITLHTSWVDSRLFGLVTRDTLFVDRHIPHIWLPNVKIVNAANDIGQGSHVMQLNRDGLIKLSEIRTVRITCPVSQAKYPFDRQVCRLHIYSNGYSSVHLKLFWHGMLNTDVPTYLPEFSFSSAEQTSENIKSRTGAEYSNLYLDIGVSRCPLRVIFRAMLPSLILVVLSYYVSFCHCPLLNGSKKPASSLETPTVNGTNTNSHHRNHHHHHVEPTTTNSVIAQQIPTTSHSQSHSPSPTFSYTPDPCMPYSSPTFNLLLVAINGMIFILVTFVAQINFIESPKSSAITGLDVWLNCMSAIIFIILWHSVQLYFNRFSMQQNSHSKNGGDSCYVNKTTSFLKLGIPLVLAVFLVIYFGVYLS